MRCVAITKRLSVLIAVGLCWQLKVCCRSHTSVSYAAASSDCGIVNRRATGGHIPKIVDTESVLMRFFAGLLAYLVGISVVISIGIIGLMALRSSNKRTSPPPTVAVEAQKKSLAKPVKQPISGEKTARPDQKKKTVRVTRKPTHQAPTIDAGRNAYGYAQEPRRIDPNLFPF